MRLENYGKLTPRVQRFHRLQKRLDFCWMVSIIIHIYHTLAFDDIFESSLHARKRLKRLSDGLRRYTTKTSGNGCGNGIFNVMKTRDAKLDMFNLTKTL